MGIPFFLERFHAAMEDFQLFKTQLRCLRRGAPGIGKSDFAMERLTLGLQERVSFVIIIPIINYDFCNCHYHRYHYHYINLMTYN